MSRWEVNVCSGALRQLDFRFPQDCLEFYCVEVFPFDFQICINFFFNFLERLAGSCETVDPGLLVQVLVAMASNT